jgi:hypothetical protein
MANLIKAPIWFWIVAILTLLWNSFGGYDYTMTHLEDPAYLAAFTTDQRAYFANMPWYLVSVWALGVWGAVAGSLLLLIRSRHAVTAFALSLFGLAASTAIQQLLFREDMARIFPASIWIMQAVIWAGAIMCLWFAWWAQRRGWLG